jgi:hypothetical protein
VGLSGLLLLFGLINKFGLFVPYFDCNNSLFILCSCYFNELILFLSKLFNYTIGDKTILVKVFNNSYISKTFLFVQRDLNYIFTILFSGCFKGFDINVNDIKMNVVGNSSNSIGNNYGNGNGDDYANDKGKGIDNNNSSNKRKFDEINEDSGNNNVKRARLDGVVSEQRTSNTVDIIPHDGNTYHADSLSMKNMAPRHSQEIIGLQDSFSNFII